MTPESHQLIESMSEGAFDAKTVDEAWEYLNSLAERAMTWTRSSRDSRPSVSQVPRAAGKFAIVEGAELSSQMAALTKKMDQMVLKSENTMTVAHHQEEAPACVFCCQFGHTLHTCQYLVSMREMMGYSTQS